MFLGDDEDGAGDGGVVGFSFEDRFDTEVLDVALLRCIGSTLNASAELSVCSRSRLHAAFTRESGTNRSDPGQARTHAAIHSKARNN